MTLTFIQRILGPVTLAEKTVHWFMYGERSGYPPRHVNCRCCFEELK